MATIHKNENNTMKERANLYFIISITLIAVPFIYIFAFIQGYHFYGIMHLVPFLIGGIGTFFWKKYTILRVGLEGKEATANALRELPDNYEVFSSVQLESDTRTARIDHIIVGENGVFVVQVKNHNGRIEGREEAKSWTQHKVGRKGGHYSNQMGNPVKQVRWQVHFLSEYLKANRMNTWVEGIVFFANPRAQVNVITERTPVINSISELTSYVTSYVPRKMLDEYEINRIKRLLLNEDVDEIEDTELNRYDQYEHPESSSVYSEKTTNNGPNKAKINSKF